MFIFKPVLDFSHAVETFPLLIYRICQNSGAGAGLKIWLPEKLPAPTGPGSGNGDFYCIGFFAVSDERFKNNVLINTSIGT